MDHLLLSKLNWPTFWTISKAIDQKVLCTGQYTVLMGVVH